MPSKDELPRRALIWGGLVWLGLATFEVLLGALLPNGVLRRTLLPVWARLAALATDLFVLALFVLVMSTLAIGVGYVGRLVAAPLARPLQAWLTKTSPSFRPLLRGIGLLLVGTIIAASTVPYVTSWASYRQLGAFPNHEALQFFGLSSEQIAQHLAQQSPALALIVPASILLLAAFLVFGLPRLVERLAASTQRRLVKLALGGAALSALVALLGHVVALWSSRQLVDPTSGSTVPLPQAYAYERAYSAGAFAAAAYNTWVALNPREVERLRRTDLKIERRPLLPMTAYVAEAEKRPFERYNVIVLLVDSMRRDEFVAFGAPRVVTPNLEQAAETGRVFAHAYASATHSDYADPCPLTSQYPLRARFGLTTYSKNPTYPRVFIYDILHALGWRTAIISSQNETWGDMLEFLDNGTFDFILHSETFKGPTYVPRHDDTLNAWIKGTKRAGKIDDRFTVNEAIQWIGDGSNQKPFFIYMNLQSSHVPYEVPADFKRRFAPEGSEYDFTFGDISADQVQVARQFYRDALAYSDEQVGRLIDHLKRIGQWDKTILFATGDTGQAFMEHNYFTHGRDLWQEVVNPMMLVHGPGVKPGVDEQLARQIDIPPTVLGLLGLPPHPSFHGVDLLNPPPGPRSAYMVVHTPLARQYGIVRGHMKLIKDVKRGRVLLYDLSADPGEKHDLSRLRPDVVDDLESRIDTWYENTVEYYEDPARQKREYPPAFED